MRGMVLQQPRPVEKAPLALREIPVPEPGPSELRVRVSCCGLCHTDLHTVEGDLTLPKLPLVPGHQIVGVVDALGSSVRNLKEGDRVGIPWLHATDGTCRFCANEQENLCERAQFTGLHCDGGYAEYATARAGFTFPIPKRFSDQHASPLLCAGIIGYRAFRLSGAKRGDRLGLYGFGASAHLVLQFAAYLGCELWVFSRSSEHRDLAIKLGASHAGKAEEAPSDSLDAAIIFAPAGELVPQALRALRKAGTLALAGITMTQIPAFDYSLLYQERVLRSVANSSRRDGEEFLDLAADVPLRTEVQCFELEEANQALQALKASKIPGAGVLKVGSGDRF
jgi:propanol-preferring alcohol dehydrogenase